MLFVDRRNAKVYGHFDSFRRDRQCRELGRKPLMRSMARANSPTKAQATKASTLAGKRLADLRGFVLREVTLKADGEVRDANRAGSIGGKWVSKSDKAGFRLQLDPLDLKVVSRQVG